MEVTVRIDSRRVYDSFVQVIRSLGIAVIREVPDPLLSEEPPSKKRPYPLEGTVDRYDDPFGPATDPNDWDAVQ